MSNSCPVCGLPKPTESTQGPTEPLRACKATECLLDHGPPTLVERWRARRARRRMMNEGGIVGIHLFPEVNAPPDVLPPSAAIKPPDGMTITMNVELDPTAVVEAIKRYERYNGPVG